MAYLNAGGGHIHTKNKGRKLHEQGGVSRALILADRTQAEQREQCFSLQDEAQT
jgi:hypothetical protein